MGSFGTSFILGRTERSDTLLVNFPLLKAWKTTFRGLSLPHPFYLMADTRSDYQTLVIAFATAGVEGFLNGIFFVLCLTALYLLTSRSPNRIHKRPRFLASLAMPMVYGSIILLLLILGHWICTTIRIVTAVILICDGISPVAYLQDVSEATYTVISILIILTVGTADALLIWRLWTVSGRSKMLIAPPIATALAFVVCGLRGSVFWIQSRDSQQASLHSEEIALWIHVATLTPAVTNLYCYACLVVCIYKIQSKTLFDDSKKLKRVLIIIVESAAIWSAWSTFVFINYHLRSFLALMAFDGGPAMAGIAFMLINVRVGLGRDATPASIDGSNLPRTGLPTFRVTATMTAKSSNGSVLSSKPRDLRRTSGVSVHASAQSHDQTIFAPETPSRTQFKPSVDNIDESSS
ncbi:hypothetical protein FA15DRAFT_705311 [Coprinopsis marcescibilis]|uniref:Uncharacterized protein n=1 Tax=Coprinopsis marcescibilis TaxID=230819 RepID=A0A5C3KSP2_COPMA|nr:hypothetical protein FA15DRAFT_705311 [Coprinopsis marcescibilis]